MQRQLTISYKTEFRRSKKKYLESGYITVPALTLKGKWMEEMGFEVGTKVRVDCQKGLLVISNLCENTIE